MNSFYNSEDFNFVEISENGNNQQSPQKLKKPKKTRRSMPLIQVENPNNEDINTTDLMKEVGIFFVKYVVPVIILVLLIVFILGKIVSFSKNEPKKVEYTPEEIERYRLFKEVSKVENITIHKWYNLLPEERFALMANPKQDE